MGLADDLLKKVKAAPIVEDLKNAQEALKDYTIPINETRKSEVEETAEYLTMTQAGRALNDIPLDDEYWDALAAHQKAYNDAKV